jgi:hypothetical protein
VARQIREISGGEKKTRIAISLPAATSYEMNEALFSGYLATHGHDSSLSDLRVPRCARSLACEWCPPEWLFSRSGSRIGPIAKRVTSTNPQASINQSPDPRGSHFKTSQSHDCQPPLVIHFRHAGTQQTTVFDWAACICSRNKIPRLCSLLRSLLQWPALGHLFKEFKLQNCCEFCFKRRWQLETCQTRLYAELRYSFNETPSAIPGTRPKPS